MCSRTPRPGTSTFTILPVCGTDECSNMNVRKSSGVCSNTAEGLTNYGETFTSYVKDPPLNCILNNRTRSSEFDYSDKFGVNTDVCRVYCSDSVEYIMADKIKAKSGTSVMFDIEFQAIKMKRSDPKLTSIIREKRTCISKIYVNNNIFETAYDWNQRYGITASEISSVLKKENIENSIDLLKVLNAKAKDENERTDNIRKLVFDLYNCNIYPKGTINNKVEVSNANKVKYVKNELSRIYSESNNYGLSGCNVYNEDGNNDCVIMGDTSYEGGAEVASPGSNNSISITGKVGTSSLVSMKSYASLNTNESRNNTVWGSLSTVKYCSGANCVKYDKNSSNPDDYNIYNGGRFSTRSRTSNLSNFVTDAVKNYEIPINDYAIFEVVTDFGFYNNSKYQVYPDTGYVKDVTDTTPSTGLIVLDPYTYPSSKNAYNECSTKSDTNGNKFNKINRCKVTYRLNSIHTYERNYKSNSFFNEINAMNKFDCYIDFEKPQTTPCNNNADCSTTESLKDNTLYRNVDISKLFNDTAPTDSNWLSDEGVIATAFIQNSSKDLKTSEDYLEYSITLTPENIKSIKSDINKNINGTNNPYSDERVFGCSIVDSTYRNCKSTFLDLLRNGNSESNRGTYGTFNGNYTSGESKHSKEVKNNKNNYNKGQ